MADKTLDLYRYKNILLDLDGTLIDSNDAHTHAFLDALEHHGIQTLQFDALRQLIGMNGEALLQHILDPETFEKLGKTLNEEHNRIFRDHYLPHLQPFPGILPLLTFLKADHKKIAICSASPDDIVQQALDILQIQPFLAGSSSGETIETGKPHPDSVAECCSKFGFAISDTLLIGDSPYDILAAQQAGVDTLGVLTGGYPADALTKIGALAVFRDLQEVLDRCEKLLESLRQEAASQSG